jgi:para-nitrobenzyl esterase
MLAAALPAALLAGPALAAPTQQASPVERLITLGVVVGSDDSATQGSYAWKGLPFARPPVGERRWRAPTDAEPWAAPRSAQQFGPACASTGTLAGPGLNNRYDETIASSLGRTVGSEDCLYLNIWRPASAVERLPVIVFVHGGANRTGYTADPMLDGAALARTAQVVVVTLNYRLGVLGFFRSARLRSSDPVEASGNFALLDIVQALRFVQREIAAFGGDPDKVTLMGESAGAVNVYALLSSPLVGQIRPALFHRVLPLSGGIARAQDLPAHSLPVLHDPALYDEQAELLLQHLLADEGAGRPRPTDMAAYLRSQSADALLNRMAGPLAARQRGMSGPIADGLVVATDPIGAIRAGRYLKLPVMAGNARDESRLFAGLLAMAPMLGGVSGRLPGDAELFAIAQNYDPDVAAQARIEQWIPAAYLPVDMPATGYAARTRMLDAHWFDPLRDSVLNALRSQQDDVWHYRFDWSQQPAPFNDVFGAAHAFDLYFVFGNFGPSVLSRLLFSRANEPGRLALSDALMRSIGAFARTGNPNHAALGTPWPPWPRSLWLDATPSALRITAP